MNFKHPLFDPRNWTHDQKESAGIIAVLLFLATMVFIVAFLIPSNLVFFSVILLFIGAFLVGLSVAGFQVEFWDERDKFKYSDD